MIHKRIGFIGSASGWGAQITETEKGPIVIKEGKLLEHLNQSSLPSYWAATVHAGKSQSKFSIPLGQDRLPIIVSQLKNLASEVQSLIKKNEFPCVIGGDHIMAAGTFSGAVEALDAKSNFGLIWIDAHMDLHTSETSPSKAYHGMPLASLLGYGDPQLSQLVSAAPKLKASDLFLIGIRSFEDEELKLLKDLNIKVAYASEVKELGFENVLKEAIAYVSKNTKAFGLSLDLDVFGPEHAPGVGSPEPNGLLPSEVLPYLHLVRESKKYAALEIAEFNPDKDLDNLTINLLENVLKELLPH